MRAIKIDPVEKTVSEIDLSIDPNKSLDELYRLIGCDLVQLVQLDRGIVLVCDEEARLKPIRGAFTFYGSGMVIAGTGIVLGGSCNRLKPLREGKRTFDLITVWMPPGEVPPPKMTLVSLESEERYGQIFSPAPSGDISPDLINSRGSMIE